MIALDVGDKRIGVAVSDPTRLIASPLDIIERSDGDPVGAVIRACEQAQTRDLIVGLPKNMDGTIGPQAKKVQAFVRALQKQEPAIKVVFWDERLSTVQARSALMDAGASKSRRRKHVDAVSAAVILQSYLEFLRAEKQDI